MRGNIYAKVGTIKDRDTIEVTEEDIKKRWQEYTEELYKKDLNDPDTRWCDHLPGARHPGMRSQADLRKHHYEQS